MGDNCLAQGAYLRHCPLFKLAFSIQPIAYPDKWEITRNLAYGCACTAVTRGLASPRRTPTIRMNANTMKIGPITMIDE